MVKAILSMKLGIILYTNDPETVFQAFRLGIFSLKQGDQVNMFLLAKGVECEDLDTDQFKVSEQIQGFLDQGGKTFSCTSCMKIRQKGATEVCPLSTMADLYRIIAESDRVISL
jgi:sulfur relay (sulfurtransferase) complex TusBCD TusD component (DsrE family)